MAIIPITLALAFYRAKQMKQANSTFSLRKVFPMFILFFLAASIITTVAALTGIDPAIFKPLQTLSNFFIVTAMAAIGLSINIGKMIRIGGEAILIGACCWVAISITSLGMLQLMGIW